MVLEVDHSNLASGMFGLIALIQVCGLHETDVLLQLSGPQSHPDLLGSFFGFEDVLMELECGTKWRNQSWA
jgi:hypothetical protein